MLAIAAGFILTSVAYGTPDVLVTEPDNGSTIVLRTNQVLGIALGADYETSGCQWAVEDTSPTGVMLAANQSYEPRQPTGGYPGTWTGRFRATAAGAAHITLVQRTKDTPPCPVRRYAIDVTVRQSAF